jgi:methyl-accepting chemotaxis protein
VNWKDISLRMKLGLGFAVLLMLVVVLALSSVSGVNRLMNDADGVIKSNNLHSVIGDVEIAHLNWAKNVAVYLMSPGEPKLDVVLDDHKCGFGKWLYGEGRKEAEQQLPALVPLLRSIEQPHYELHTSARAILDARSGPGGVIEAREVFMNTSIPALQNVSSVLENINHTVEAGLMTSATMLQNATHQRKIILWVAFATLLLGIVVSVLLSETIRGPIIQAIEAVRKLSEGDVSVSLDSNRKDEIGALAADINRAVAGQKQKAMLASAIADGDLTVDIQVLSEKDALGNALVKMVESLRTVISQTVMVAEQIDLGSNEVAGVSQDLSEGATESAASIEEISSSMGQMAEQTKTNALNSAQASELSRDSRDVAHRGNAHMQELIGAMGEINGASQNISKIIKVIDEIAFQTNLLALNAAVEAARAGQHGKGFAVVAEEVRNLAARSAKAASETAELIEGSVEKVRQGTTIADRTAKALQEIVEGAGKVTDLVAEISAASTEQAQGIGEVNTGLSQIDDVIQRNTASAEEGAASAEELSAQAAQLKALIHHFKIRGYKQSYHTQPTHVQQRAQRALPESRSVHEERRQKPSGWQSLVPNPATQSAYMESVKQPFNPNVRPESVIKLDDSEFGKY